MLKKPNFFHFSIFHFMYPVFVVKSCPHKIVKVSFIFLDTEEASETDMGKSEEYTEIKEQ